jgi:hypothetical protein
VTKTKLKTSTALAKQIDPIDTPKTVAQIVTRTEERTPSKPKGRRKREQPPVRGPPPPGMSRLLRFVDLKALGIVANYASLKVLTEDYGFPPGKWLSTNAHVWTQSEARGKTRGRRKDEAEPAPRPKLTKEARAAKAGAAGRPHPDLTDRLAPYPDEVEAEAAPAKTAAAPP